MRTTAERKLASQRILAERLQARRLKNASQHWNVGADHPRAKLTEDDVRAIRASDGESLQALSERYRVGVSYIGSIRRGRVWRHVG